MSWWICCIINQQVSLIKGNQESIQGLEILAKIANPSVFVLVPSWISEEEEKISEP